MSQRDIADHLFRAAKNDLSNAERDFFLAQADLMSAERRLVRAQQVYTTIKQYHDHATSDQPPKDAS